MMVPEKHCKIAADSPPVSDTASSLNKADVHKTVLRITSPDDGIVLMPTKDYGIGIDCHICFLEITQFLYFNKSVAGFPKGFRRFLFAYDHNPLFLRTQFLYGI